MFIYTDRPFRTGDWIEWGDGSGFVQDIGLRVTRVRTFDNEHLTAPNSQLTDGVIKNYDKHGTLRLKFVFRIAFEDDIDEATDIILDVARAQEGILAEPEPSVNLTEINDASFGLQSRIWIRDPGQSDFIRDPGPVHPGGHGAVRACGRDDPLPAPNHRRWTGRAGTDPSEARPAE